MRGSKTRQSIIIEMSNIWRWCTRKGYDVSKLMFLDLGAGALNLLQNLAATFPGSDIIGIDIDEVLRNLFPYSQFELLRNELDLNAEMVSGVSTTNRQFRAHFSQGLGVWTGEEVTDEGNYMFCKDYKMLAKNLWLDEKKACIVLGFIAGVPNATIRDS